MNSQQRRKYRRLLQREKKPIPSYLEKQIAEKVVGWPTFMSSFVEEQKPKQFPVGSSWKLKPKQFPVGSSWKLNTEKYGKSYKNKKVTVIEWSEFPYLQGFHTVTVQLRNRKEPLIVSESELKLCQDQ
jgi:hypothetical protein